MLRKYESTEMFLLDRAVPAPLGKTLMENPSILAGSLVLWKELKKDRARSVPLGSPPPPLPGPVFFSVLGKCCHGMINYSMQHWSSADPIHTERSLPLAPCVTRKAAPQDRAAGCEGGAVQPGLCKPLEDGQSRRVPPKPT